jgi:hypothetical protein
MGKLVLFHVDGAAKDFKLDHERVTIGRRPDNDVCLPQAAVSGEHAAVVTILADSFLEDLGSTNGTLVNGKVIAKHFLHDRDVIDIGRELLVYVVDDMARPEAPARASEALTGGETGDAAVAVEPAAKSAPQRDKRRSDGIPAFSGHSVDAIQRFVAAEIESGAADPSPIPLATAPALPPEPVETVPEALPRMRVLSGPGTGRVVALREGETIIGRAGVQVVALRRGDDGVRVVPVEGATPARINGTPVALDGQRFGAGDILEVAGSTLELVPAAEASA